MPGQIIPQPDGLTSLGALRAMLREHSVLAAFEAFHAKLGEVFRLQLPGFHPIVLVGPEANAFVLMEQRGQLRWRSETDPIAKLLGHGLLVEDGEAMHDRPRQVMSEALHLAAIQSYVSAMWRGTDHELRTWQDGQSVDMLDAMRRLSLLIVFDALFGDDFTPALDRLWDATLRLMRYISPGLWMLWKGAPSPGYTRARAALDQYLYAIIARRRRQPPARPDLLSLLMDAGYDDAMIRDEMMTMVVAGHDTTTALLAWAWYLLGRHPHILQAAAQEAQQALGSRPDPHSPPDWHTLQNLPLIDSIVKETLRLYPPAHLGSRIAAADMEYKGYPIPAGARVIYSIYLTHRLPEYWPDPLAFRPERWREGRPVKFSYLPFGGGPRLCIGAQFGELQARLVLARVLQQFALTGTLETAHVHMGATIEPRQGRHGVIMRVQRLPGATSGQYGAAPALPETR